jgi:hypothetical protein
MRHALDDANRDKDGRIVFGNPRGPGCPFCGAMATTTSYDGKVVWHHAGTSCCDDAIKRELTWRRDELSAMRNQYRQAAADIEAYARTADDAVGGTRNTIREEAARRRAGLALRAERVYKPKAADLEDEIADLEAKLADRRRLLPRP